LRLIPGGCHHHQTPLTSQSLDLWMSHHLRLLCLWVQSQGGGILSKQETTSWTMHVTLCWLRDCCTRAQKLTSTPVFHILTVYTACLANTTNLKGFRTSARFELDSATRFLISLAMVKKTFSTLRFVLALCMPHHVKPLKRLPTLAPIMKLGGAHQTSRNCAKREGRDIKNTWPKPSHVNWWHQDQALRLLLK
jgi:hypothetical protein